jgi:hypothetical protein
MDAQSTNTSIGKSLKKAFAICAIVAAAGAVGIWSLGASQGRKAVIIYNTKAPASQP